MTEWYSSRPAQSHGMQDCIDSVELMLLRKLEATVKSPDGGLDGGRDEKTDAIHTALEQVRSLP